MAKRTVPDSMPLSGGDVQQNRAILDMYRVLARRLQDEIRSGVTADIPPTTGAQRFFFDDTLDTLYFDTDSGWVAIGQSATSDIHAYAPGSFTIPTGYYRIMTDNLQLTGSQQVTIAGTGQLRIT